MQPRLAAAVVLGRTLTMLSRRLSIGGGTTFPGTAARWIDRGALGRVALQLPRGSVVVTGTNGKTTTARIIATILRSAGLRPVHNRSGANLLGGVTSALLNVAAISGRPNADIGVFEVDEATLPVVVREVRPSVLVFTNLFRDQLDRYGEVDFVAGNWRTALATLPSDTTVLLNADDPLVAGLGIQCPAQVRYYGLEDERYGRRGLEHTADTRACARCGASLDYSVNYYGHVGKYACRSCGRTRPRPDFRAIEVQLDSTRGSRCSLATPQGDLHLRVAVPGLYNVYNAMSAAAVGLTLGVAPSIIAESIASFAAAFGRIERVEVDGRHVFLALVKNPVGFNEVLRMLFLEPGQKQLLILINDNFADGTDISWLWDVDFEILAGRLSGVVISGIRAEDMALRLKYAGVETGTVVVEKDVAVALRSAVEGTARGETLFVLPTYTAMLEIRDVMRRMGYVGRFWED